MNDPKIVKALEVVGSSFAEIGAKLDESSKGQITYADALMSGLAVYQLKIASLLQYDEKMRDPKLRALFGIERSPSDTHLRVMLDRIEPDSLRPVFKEFLNYLRCSSYLERFKNINDCYAISIDATQYFISEDVHCDNCLEKHHKDGSVTYSHQLLSGSIVKAGVKEVVPICPEPIVKQDGLKKNDCEINAFYRLIHKFRSDHPKLPVIFLLDSLHSKAPVILLIKKFVNNHFVIGAKPGDHKYLFNWIEQQETEKLVKTLENGHVYHYEYYNGAPLNESNEDVVVNFLKVKIYRGEKKPVLTMSFVTDLQIDSTNVEQILVLGRSRWKIENETFNTLKNQGYNFEHNYGHGYQYLSVILAMLMMLAFAIDQFQQMACPIFRKIQEKITPRYFFWAAIQQFFLAIISVSSWEQFYLTILNGIQPVAVNSS